MWQSGDSSTVNHVLRLTVPTGLPYKRDHMGLSFTCVISADRASADSDAAGVFVRELESNFKTPPLGYKSTH